MKVMMTRLVGALLLVVMGLPLTAAVPAFQTQAQPTQAQPAQAQVPLNPQLGPREYLVGPSDVLKVQFTGLIPTDVDMSNLYPVQADGRIQIKYLGPIDVQGKGAIWIGDHIKGLLVSGGFYQDTITVTVTVQEYRSQEVFINGSVNTPGVQQLKGSEMKLSRAITAAGGFAQNAGQEIEIRRTGQDGKVQVITVLRSQLDQGEDPDLLADDEVQVKKGQSFYVNGEVNSPGEKTWQPGMTLSRALALSQGAKSTASINRSYIKRLVKDKNGKEDYQEFKNLKDNTPIEPNDEIVIRRKLM